ncbi:unnamed protein product [Rotaria sordida]|uniref:Uncharacterized protein n=1 Tax=Rotaria sordida TaxID=392033 RepID=A0A813TAK9_9BILA|nr:unnamed protein product [Rotaria sordida]
MDNYFIEKKFKFERLFDYLFGDNDFVVAYHASRRIKDYNATEWKVNEKTGKRERLCTYKVDVSAVFGATTICSNEKQIIQCELSKSHYIIDTEVRNEGIKYADAFFIASRYCLIQTGPNKSHLKVTCEVRYLRSLMIIIKSFIEKNAMAALQDSYTDLIKRMEVECSRRQRRSSTTINNEQDKENQLKKKHSQKQQSIKLNSTINDSSPHQQRKQATHNETIHHTQNAKLVLSSSSNCLSSSEWSKSNVLIPFCFIIMLILVSVNIFLCIKLNEIDQMTDRLSKNYPLWSYGYPYPKEEYQWSLLLKRQEEYYQAKLTGLHSVLVSTHNALKNVTDALNELTKCLSWAWVEEIIEFRRPNGILLSFGKETALNCGVKLHEEGILQKYSCNILGTPVQSIQITTDRCLFTQKMSDIGEKVVPHKVVESLEEALISAEQLGYPVVVRATFPESQRISCYVDNREELISLVPSILTDLSHSLIDKSQSSIDKSKLLIHKTLKGWKKIGYEVVRD